jgi:hypothetical protein
MRNAAQVGKWIIGIPLRRFTLMAFLSRIPGCAFFMAALLPIRANAQPVRVGAPAPAFTATDSRGQTQSLARDRGKYVVLEWHNQGCRYTRKHYVTGNMQALQREWTAKGVVWFNVISSAFGQQGYVTPKEENSFLAQMHAAPTAAQLHPVGEIGHLYFAKTTPQMIVIDPSGNVIYDGAIDDRPTPVPQMSKGQATMCPRR